VREDNSLSIRHLSLATRSHLLEGVLEDGNASGAPPTHSLRSRTHPSH
jgi:hypothetical protein